MVYFSASKLTSPSWNSVSQEQRQFPPGKWRHVYWGGPAGGAPLEDGSLLSQGSPGVVGWLQAGCAAPQSFWGLPSHRGPLRPPGHGVKSSGPTDSLRPGLPIRTCLLSCRRRRTERAEATRVLRGRGVTVGGTREQGGADEVVGCPCRLLCPAPASCSPDRVSGCVLFTERMAEQIQAGSHMSIP